MKLASFLYQGKRSYGIVQAEGVIDLGRRLGDRYSDLKALLQGNGLAGHPLSQRCRGCADERHHLFTGD
jgi:hypothetical protein